MSAYFLMDNHLQNLFHMALFFFTVATRREHVGADAARLRAHLRKLLRGN